MLTLEDIRDAAKRVYGVTTRTPVLSSSALDDVCGAQLFFKCENLQKTGAFKIRGAYNAISRLSREQLRCGVVTFSSGNHGQAVALAARLVGTDALVVMPEDAPDVKLAATRAHGAEVMMYDRYTQDRAVIVDQIAKDCGCAIIPPFDHPDVMAGQGTAALELLEEVGPLDTLIVPVGGGGLISGCATAAKGLHPGIRVVGVEPASGDDTRRSLETGARVRIEVPRTIADGLAADAPGKLTFPVVRKLVDEIVVVDDSEIRTAMLTAFEQLKLVVEPSGAVGLAALLARRLRNLSGRVGVVLSGGNVSMDIVHGGVPSPSPSFR
jgi:threo-3-hydroxy-L-aspartate ammonia-lyase